MISMTKKRNIEETLRDELIRRMEDGETVADISRAAGVNIAVVWRFIHRERTMRLDTAARLAASLKLKLVGPRRRKKTD